MCRIDNNILCTDSIFRDNSMQDIEKAICKGFKIVTNKRNPEVVMKSNAKVFRMIYIFIC